MAVAGLGKADYLASANDIAMTWAMIETAQALDNLDDICTTPGIDGVFVGPNDLSVSLSKGAVVDPAIPEVRDALGQIVAAAERHGVYPGIFANTPELARSFAEMGFCFISGGSDMGMLTAGSAALLDAIRG